MHRLLGPAADVEGFCHWENRRRILKHYFVTHPDTLRMFLGAYALARDSNPVHFALERGWQMASGQEMFTGQQVSQLGAAGEFFTALAAGRGRGQVDDRHAAGARLGCPRAGAAGGPSQGGDSARSAASRGASSGTRAGASSDPLRRASAEAPAPSPLQRQHRPLRRREPSRPHPNWSKRSRARTPRRRCPQARVCVRTSPSSRRCQSRATRTVPSAPAPGKMRNSRGTSST